MGFQSAGRIIGWLNGEVRGRLVARETVSIRRADYWLVELKAHHPTRPAYIQVSIRRADYWLVEPV